MANYMDGAEGGKHNSDNCEVSISKTKTKKVVFEIEVDADTNIEAAKTVQDWLQNDPMQSWQFYVQDVDSGVVVSIDLDEDESCMELPVHKYHPMIEN